MDDETTPDPYLSQATVADLLAELGRRVECFVVSYIRPAEAEEVGLDKIVVGEIGGTARCLTMAIGLATRLRAQLVADSLAATDLEEE